MRFDGIEDVAKRVALPIAAGLTLFTATGLAIADRVASATLMAGLFVVTAIFIRLPDIESIKAWGVEAKMIAKTLDEAKASLAQLRKLAELSARQTYWAISTQGRWSDGKVGPKNALAVATKQLLIETGVEPAKIEAAQEPFVKSIDIDLSNILKNVAASLIRRRMDLHSKRVNRLQSKALDQGPENQSAYDLEKAKVERWNALSHRLATLPFSVEQIGQFIRSDLTSLTDDADEQRKMNDLVSEFERLNSECRNAGHYTEEVVTWFGRYGGSAPGGTGLLITERGLSLSDLPD